MFLASETNSELFSNLINAAGDTLLMTIISIIIAYVIGLPLGVILYITSNKGLRPNKIINFTLGTIVNIFRSIPCLLLIVILIPVTNVIFGKGSWSGNWYSMIVPLVVASFAFVARMVEQSLAEVNTGVIEAAKSMGATDLQIILKVLLPESKSSLISGFAVVIVSVIGYTSFAGYISAGGLIVEAFNLGYYSTNQLWMWICIFVVIIIVQILQEGGLYISKKLDKRRK